MSNENPEQIPQEEIKVVVEQIGRRSEFYREVIPSSFMGGIRPGFLEVAVISSRVDAIEWSLTKKSRIELIEEVNLKIAPQEAKKLIRFLLRNIILYEKAYGKIILDDEVEPENVKVSEEEINSKLDELISIS